MVTHRILPIIISGEVNTYPREIESRLIVHLCRVIGDPLLPAGSGPDPPAARRVATRRPGPNGCRRPMAP